MLECMYLTEESKADTKRLSGMHVGAGNDGAMMSETAFMPHGWESPARTRARATPRHEHTFIRTGDAELFSLRLHPAAPVKYFFFHVYE